MKDKITINDLDKAIAEQLNSYASDIRLKVHVVTDTAVRKLVQKTKKRAPKGVEGRKTRDGKNRIPGTFAKHITRTVEDKGVLGTKGIWHVNGDEYRLTHLLVHGHQLRQGGRAQGNDFLDKSVQEVSKEYVEELVKAVEKID